MAATSPRARGLIAVSLVGVLAFAALQGRAAWEDSGGFAFVLFGIPLGCAAVALVAERPGGALLAPAVVAVAGVVSLAWSLLTAGGIGLGFAPSSMLLVVAALRSWADRREVEAASLRT